LEIEQLCTILSVKVNRSGVILRVPHREEELHGLPRRFIYKNGTVVMSCDASFWADYDKGGSIGLLAWGSATLRFDDFGGGTITAPATATPTATFTGED
jgi:hypothetical protein